MITSGRLPTMQIWVWSGTVGLHPYGRNIITLWLFTVLCCPFFSGTRPGWTAEPIFTLYSLNDMFPRKCLLGIMTADDVIWGKYALNAPSQKNGVNRQFQAKMAKYTNRNISKTINRIKMKFEDRTGTHNCTDFSSLQEIEEIFA